MSEYFITKDTPTSYVRTGVDNTAKLKVLVTGDYPIVCGDIAGKFVRGQSFELPIVKTTTSFTPIGGNSSFRTFRLADGCCDECDINGDVATGGGSTELSLNNSGALHFVGNSTATASKSLEINPNCSRVLRFKMTKADFAKFTSGEMLFFDGVYNGATDYGLAMRKYFGNNSTTGLPTHVHFYFYYKSIVGDNVQLSIAVGNNANFEKIFDGNFHNIAMIVSSDTKTNFKIYLDNTLIGSTSGALFNTFTATKVLKLQSRSGNNAWKDVYAFNFDMSDANVPYTLADYQKRKPIPVECLDTSAEQRALLALENYTINSKVLDYSGNNNHASTSGFVKGDNDTRIQVFVNAITTTTSEQN